MMWNDGMGWTGWIVMIATALAFWALVVVVVVALFRDDRRGRPRTDGPPTSDDTAGRILDQRFARGEIDADEYRARQQALHGARW